MRPAVQRPVGVTILAILAIIGGVLSLIVGIAAIAGGAVISSGAANGVNSGLGIVAIILGVVSLLSGVLTLAFGIGALRGAAWAWILGIVAESINVIIAIGGIINGAAHNNVGGAIEQYIVGLVIALFILIYLNSANVKAFFGRGPSTTAGLM